MSEQCPVQSQPLSADALVARGDQLRSNARMAEARASYAAALRLQVERADAWAGYADTSQAIGCYRDALTGYDRALALNPDWPAAWHNRSNALRLLGLYDAALESVTRALALAPDFVEALNNRGNLLRRVNRHAEALADYDRAIALRPAWADVHGNRGNALRELNRIDEARDAYQQAIERAPERVAYYVSLASVTRLSREHACYRALEAFLQREAQLGPHERIALHFAMGDALTGFGAHQDGFDHFIKGNALQRALLHYDETAVFASFERLRRTYGRERIESVRGEGNPAASPVFIVGMPRSGSTLIEQVLASHPQVYGAGEYGAFTESLDEHVALDTGGRTRDAILEGLSPADFTALGDAYQRRIAQLGGIERGHLRVVDKSLPNFVHLGLIHLALPNARFIHVRRSAVDTCLSCFSKWLPSMPFTFEPGELGRYYAEYERQIAHWRSVLPPGALLDVQYENLVDDLPGEARRMLEHCGLEWDPACLAFDRNARAVATASAQQVRQPIHKDALRRWRPSAQQLAPLLKGLGALADPDGH
jgi:tetratricopeptide (TPR) repeat protein